MSAIPLDTLTILECSRSCTASKQIVRKADGEIEIKGFNAGKFFRVQTVPVNGIDELSAALKQLETMAKTFVIRGTLKEAVDPMKSYQRLKVNFLTPEQGKWWVLIDLDKLPVPGGATVIAAIEHLVQKLPSEFHDVSYHYQLSSSAGFSAPGTLSAHVWFWLTDPWPDQKLKAWAKKVNQAAHCKLVDTALFNDVQAHYTAAPVFHNVDDPFPTRSALVRKERDAVSICEIAEPEREVFKAARPIDGATGFEAILSQIGDHDGGDGFHEPIIRAVASYVSTHGRDGTDVEGLYETVRDRVLAADSSQHDTEYIQHMASREHVVPAIQGALTKFGETPPSRRRSRVVENIRPPKKTLTLGATEAYESLSSIIESIILGETK